MVHLLCPPPPEVDEGNSPERLGNNGPTTSASAGARKTARLEGV